MRDVDRYVDLLYEPALKKLAIPFVKTEWHRYAGDLNRLPEDVDASSVVGNPNPAGMHNRGFHWTVTTFNEVLMTQAMPLTTHQKLVHLIYEPFHESVRNHYEKNRAQGAKDIYHLDVHSMPSLGTKMHRDPGEQRAEIVVSDCHGKSAKPEFVDLVIAAYTKAGFKVGYNWPYFGGRVSEQYGQPAKGHHAVQVEMNRALYMHEDTKRLNGAHVKIQEKLEIALRYIFDHLQSNI